MKISRVVVTFDIAPPRARPISDARQVLDGGGNISVRIEATDGIRDVVAGTSWTGFGRLRSAPAILAKILEEELAPEIIGQDPFQVRKVRDILWRLTDYHGSTGLTLLAIAAIDVAL